MRSITVKQIPDELYARLRASADTNRRSLNKEVLVCLERALAEACPSVEDVLARARAWRQRTALHPIEDVELNEAKRSGRP